MKHSLQTAFKSWIGLTLLVIASLVAIYLQKWHNGLESFYSTMAAFQSCGYAWLNSHNLVIAWRIALHAG